MLPLALAPEGWTAISGIGGALVGALAGGLVTAYLAHRRRESLAKAGARLISDDLRVAGSHITIGVDQTRWFPYMEWNDANWREYRGTLAERLSALRFGTLSEAIRAVRETSESLTPSPGDPWTMLLPADVRALKSVLGEIAAARNVLAELSGAPMSDGGGLGHRYNARPRDHGAPPGSSL